jgi:hypothetical protein
MDFYFVKLLHFKENDASLRKVPRWWLCKCLDQGRNAEGYELTTRNTLIVGFQYSDQTIYSRRLNQPQSTEWKLPSSSYGAQTVVRCTDNTTTHAQPTGNTQTENNHSSFFGNLQFYVTVVLKSDKVYHMPAGELIWQFHILLWISSLYIRIHHMQIGILPVPYHRSAGPTNSQINS